MKVNQAMVTSDKLSRHATSFGRCTGRVCRQLRMENPLGNSTGELQAVWVARRGYGGTRSDDSRRLSRALSWQQRGTQASAPPGQGAGEACRQRLIPNRITLADSRCFEHTAVCSSTTSPRVETPSESAVGVGTHVGITIVITSAARCLPLLLAFNSHSTYR